LRRKFRSVAFGNAFEFPGEISERSPHATAAEFLILADIGILGCRHAAVRPLSSPQSEFEQNDVPPSRYAVPRGVRGHQAAKHKSTRSAKTKEE